VAQEPATIASAKAPEPALAELPSEKLPKVYRARADAERRLKEAAAAGIIWAGISAVLAVMIVSAVVFRVDMVRLWPRTAGAFASVGLPVNQVGLVIEQLSAEPSLRDGDAALTISGVLRNVENKAVSAPPLRLSLLNPAGKRVGGKVAAVADPLVPPGETRHFAIAILDPPSTAKDLEIGFVLYPGAAKAVKAAVVDPHVSARLSLRGATESITVLPAEAIAAKPLPPESPGARSAH